MSDHEKRPCFPFRFDPTNLKQIGGHRYAYRADCPAGAGVEPGWCDPNEDGSARYVSVTVDSLSTDDLTMLIELGHGLKVFVQVVEPDHCPKVPR